MPTHPNVAGSHSINHSIATSMANKITTAIVAIAIQARARATKLPPSLLRFLKDILLPVYLEPLLEKESHIASVDASLSSEDYSVGLLRVSPYNSSVCANGINRVPVTTSNQHCVWLVIHYIYLFMMSASALVSLIIPLNTTLIVYIDCTCFGLNFIFSPPNSKRFPRCLAFHS